MKKLSNIEYLREIIAGGGTSPHETPYKYPPPIALTLGFELIEVGEGTATIELKTDLGIHANPMGTLHGGVFCDVADAAIGMAHLTTLKEGESLTSVDLQI